MSGQTLQERARDLSAHQRTYLGSSPLTDLLCEMASALDAKDAEITGRDFAIYGLEAEIARLRDALTGARDDMAFLIKAIRGGDPAPELDIRVHDIVASISAALSKQGEE